MKIQVTEEEKIIEILKNNSTSGFMCKKYVCIGVSGGMEKNVVIVLFIITEKLERSQIFVTKISSSYLTCSKPKH